MKPDLITRNNHPDFAKIIISPDLMESFEEATLALNKPGIRAVVWIPEKTPPQLSFTSAHGEQWLVTHHVSEAAVTELYYSENVTLTVPVNNRVSDTARDRAGIGSLTPHVDGLRKFRNIWEHESANSRRCIHTVQSIRQNAGTIFYEAIPSLNMLADNGCIKRSEWKNLGKAWQTSTSCALYFKSGGSCEEQLVHRAPKMPVSTSSHSYPPKITRIVHSYDYDCPF